MGLSRELVSALHAGDDSAAERLAARAGPDASEADVINGAFQRARRKTVVPAMLERGLWAMRSSAFLTARECLQRVTSPAGVEGQVQNNFAARAWLLRAIVECAAAGWNGPDIVMMLADKSPAMPPEALRGLDEADQLDKAFTEAWRDACANDDLARALRRLFQGLPRAQQACSPQEYAVLLFRQAIECARLARRLDECAGNIPDGREARDTILAWSGQTLEQLLTGPLAGRVGGVRFRGDTQFERATFKGDARRTRLRPRKWPRQRAHTQKLVGRRHRMEQPSLSSYGEAQRSPRHERQASRSQRTAQALCPAPDLPHGPGSWLRRQRRPHRTGRKDANHRPSVCLRGQASAGFLVGLPGCRPLSHRGLATAREPLPCGMLMPIIMLSVRGSDQPQAADSMPSRL